MKIYFHISECSLSYAKIMQTSEMKIYFHISECSLSYAKIQNYHVFCFKNDDNLTLQNEIRQRSSLPYITNQGSLRKRPPCLFSSNAAPYGRLIASEGQTSAQVPHSVQASGSIEYLSPSDIAPDGHSSIHVPQAIQSSPIT